MIFLFHQLIAEAQDLRGQLCPLALDHVGVDRVGGDDAGDAEKADDDAGEKQPVPHTIVQLIPTPMMRALRIPKIRETTVAPLVALLSRRRSFSIEVSSLAGGAYLSRIFLISSCSLAE